METNVTKKLPPILINEANQSMRKIPLNYVHSKIHLFSKNHKLKNLK